MRNLALYKPHWCSLNSSQTPKSTSLSSQASLVRVLAQLDLEEDLFEEGGEFGKEAKGTIDKASRV